MDIMDLYWNKWYEGDYTKAIELFFDHLNDDDVTDYDGGQPEKDANLVKDLEILLDRPREIYPRIREELKNIDRRDHRRYTYFTAIREDLWYKPNHFRYAKKIINSNLNTEEGFTGLLSAILISFDKFTLKEQEKIIKRFNKRRKRDYNSIGINIIKAIFNLQQSNFGKFKKFLQMACDTCEKIPNVVYTHDHGYFEIYIYYLLEFFSNFERIFPKFKELDRIKERFFNHFNNQNSFFRMITPEAFSKYYSLLTYFFNTFIDYIHVPAFLSDFKLPKELINKFKELMDFFNDEIESKLFDHRVRSSRKNKEIFEDSITAFKDTYDFLYIYSKLAIEYQRIMNYEEEINEDELGEFIKNLELIIENFYFTPARIISRIMKNMLTEKINSAHEARRVLKQFIEGKKKIISILGPFNNNDVNWEKNKEYFQKISLWISSKNENFVPQFIPAQFQGIFNPTLFDIFVNMSKFIICLYIPSTSSGHVDEIARLLERREIPPTILLSNCEFPTTTQITGIQETNKMKVFCFNENSSSITDCPYYKKCVFTKECRKEKLPTSNIERTLDKAFNWTRKI